VIEEAGLSDPRLAGDEYQRATARERPAQCGAEREEVAVAPEELAHGFSVA
jgi:hypothetical protein